MIHHARLLVPSAISEGLGKTTTKPRCFPVNVMLSAYLIDPSRHERIRSLPLVIFRLEYMMFK